MGTETLWRGVPKHDPGIVDIQVLNHAGRLEAALGEQRPHHLNTLLHRLVREECRAARVSGNDDVAGDDAVET